MSEPNGYLWREVWLVVSASEWGRAGQPPPPRTVRMAGPGAVDTVFCLSPLACLVLSPHAATGLGFRRVKY
jgi:hypothetical protein